MTGAVANDVLLDIDVDDVAPSPYQPRDNVDVDHVHALAASIVEMQQLIQPVLVRQVRTQWEGRERSWQLICGEHRWRAVRQLGWTQISAISRPCTDAVAAATALADFARKGIRTMELAKGMKRLATMGMSHRAIGQSMGAEGGEVLSRSRVATLIAITRLPGSLHGYVNADTLTPKHAEHLLRLPIDAQTWMGERAASERWSTRKLEQMVNRFLDPPAFVEADPNIAYLERGLSEYFASPIKLRHDAKSKRGELVISYAGVEVLEGILERLGFSENR